jgi:hypothetical protein
MNHCFNKPGEKELSTMKVRLLPLLFFFLMCFSFLWITPVYGEARKEKWTFMGFTKYRDALYIETNSISHPSPHIVWVWSFIAPSEKSKYLQQIKREVEKSKKPAGGLKSTEILNEIDCTKNRIRYLQIVYLNSDGSIIHSSDNTDPGWKIINPGSLWQNMRNAVCGN